MVEYYSYCEKCGDPIRVVDSMLGELTECPGCGHNVAIPAPLSRPPRRRRPLGFGVLCLIIGGVLILLGGLVVVYILASGLSGLVALPAASIALALFAIGFGLLVLGLLITIVAKFRRKC